MDTKRCLSAQKQTRKLFGMQNLINIGKYISHVSGTYLKKTVPTNRHGYNGETLSQF